MSVVGLFAGIGGFELAFERSGFNAALLVEIDPAAAAVLSKRFPDAELRSDIIDVSEIPHGTTIITAGFPCQNLSMAGDKSGITGRKSGIVDKMFELIQGSDVPTVVIENVYFMLQLDGGRAMEWLVGRFESLGYHWAYRVLNTMDFGLPHRRRRVYLVASKDIDPRRVLFASDLPNAVAPKADLTHPLGFYWTEGRSGLGLTVDGIPPLKVGSTLGIPSAPAVLFPDGDVLMPSLAACERLQGFPVGWTGAALHAKGEAWRLVGNAVSVPVASWVAQSLKNPGSLHEFECKAFGPGGRWPSGAFNVGDGRFAVEDAQRPVALSSQTIEHFRDSEWTRLSDRALNGFIRRAQEGSLRMPEGFLEALVRAPRKSSSVKP
jgi:DNA (cytosine-5)-methyltransferase 1